MANNEYIIRNENNAKTGKFYYNISNYVHVSVIVILLSSFITWGGDFFLFFARFWNSESERSESSEALESELRLAAFFRLLVIFNVEYIWKAEVKLIRFFSIFPTATKRRQLSSAAKLNPPQNKLLTMAALVVDALRQQRKITPNSQSQVVRRNNDAR